MTSTIIAARQATGELCVVEMDPLPHEQPAQAAPEVLPSRSVVAIPAMTPLNGPRGGMPENLRPGFSVLLLGLSSPLSLWLFNVGVVVVAGAQVVSTGPTMEPI